MNPTASDVLEHISDGFIALDAEWRFTYANGRAGRILQRSPESLIGRSLWTEFPEAEGQPFGEACRRVRREGAPQTVAAFHDRAESRIHPSGDGLSVYLTELPASSEEAATAALPLPPQDLVTRDELRRQEAYFRSLTELSTDLVAVLESDGTIRYHNAASIRVIGYSEQELKGVDAFSLIHPDDCAAARERFEHMLAFPGEIVACHYRARHADGGWRIMESEGRSLLHDENVRGLVVNSRDVTARVRAEEKLRESEERFRLVTRATNDVIWDYDLETRHLYMGESLLDGFGYEPPETEDALGWWEERLHPDDRDRVRRGFDAALDSDASAWTDEYRFRCAGGDFAIVLDRALIQRDADGRAVRMVGSMQDLTEKREAEMELRALFSAIEDVIMVLDAEGRYLKVAPASEHLLYRPSSDLLGRTLHDVLPRRQADHLLGALREALAIQRTVNLEYDLTIRGEVRWFAATVSPMSPGTVVWVARDITERVQAEEALRASERRYREIFEQSRDTIYVCRPDGTVLDVNRAAEEVFGAPREEILRHSIVDFYADPGQCPAAVGSIQAPGAACDREVRLRRLTGEEFDALVSATLLCEGGEVVGIQGTIRDVTESREAEKRLVAQEARFRSLIENVHDVVAILTAERTFRYISPSVQRALGYSTEEILASIPGPLLLPEDQKAMGAALDEASRAPGDSRTLEVRARHRDGSWRRMEVVVLNLLHDPDVEGLILTARDVTGRSEAEEALHRSEAWFRSLTQNTMDIITVLDEQGRIRYATPSGARALGYPEGELRQRVLLELIHPEDRPSVSEALACLTADGTEPVTLTVRIQAKDGTWQTHQAIAQSLLRNPAVQGIVVNSRDVTEQRLLEAQLVQAQKMEAVGRLAGGVAHDFNNVLMAITGFAALLEGEIEPTEDTILYLTEIHKATERAASLTRQLLAFGRKQALRPKVVNLNSVVEAAGGMLRRLIREDIDLVFLLSPRLSRCRVDPHQVEQVLVNLVVNAADALPAGGTVEIATRNRTIGERDQRTHPYLQSGVYTTFSVRDTGHGMDADTLSRVFDPFFTTKDPGRGTGLGLSMVYGIIKQSGGYVLAESLPDAGSTFTVLLPRVKAEEDAREPASNGPLQRGRGTILLAEDEEAVRLLARVSLKKAGYAVLEARDGEEALRIASEHPGPIDLLLTDVIMPNLGGFALAERLRERRPSLRVVFMSGYAGSALPEPVPGEAELLAKPITPESLTHRVREAMK